MISQKFAIFMRLYLDELHRAKSNYDAYELAERRFEAIFGRRAYKSNAVFKVVLSRNKKRLRVAKIEFKNKKS